MIHHSPLPDVEIADLPLTEYVLAGGAGQPDKPALIDGGSGRVMTYGELEAAIRSLGPPRRRSCGSSRARWRTTSRSGGSR